MTATIHNETDGSVCEQQGADTILRASLRAGLGFSHECNSGGCGACKFELLEGQLENLWPDAPGLSERDRRRGRHLACQCRALGAVRIKAPLADEYRPVILPKRQTARLLESRMVSHDIREFRFAGDGGADFLPGQYAMLGLAGVGAERAYSMSNTGNADGEWHFQIRRVPGGQATGMLFETLQQGDAVTLDGPYGLAYLRRESPRDIVCVAGGSGLAPMISIARGAAAAGMLAARTLYFFYGARTPRDVCGADMLADLTAQGARIVYLPVVSQPGDDGAWTGATGFVHQALAGALPRPLGEYEFYFAGPPPMTQALQEALMIEHSVPFGQVHFDRFY